MQSKASNVNESNGLQLNTYAIKDVLRILKHGTNGGLTPFPIYLRSQSLGSFRAGFRLRRLCKPFTYLLRKLASDHRIWAHFHHTQSRMEVELPKARVDGQDESWNVDSLENVRNMFAGLRRAFSLCPRKQVVNGDEEGEEMTRMVRFWGDGRWEREQK